MRENRSHQQPSRASSAWHLLCIAALILLALLACQTAQAKGMVSKITQDHYTTSFGPDWHDGKGDSWQSSCEAFYNANGFTSKEGWDFEPQPSACQIVYGMWRNTYYYIYTYRSQTRFCPAFSSEPQTNRTCANATMALSPAAKCADA